MISVPLLESKTLRIQMKKDSKPSKFDRNEVNKDSDFQKIKCNVTPKLRQNQLLFLKQSPACA